MSTNELPREAQPADSEGAQRFELALAAGRLGDWSWDAATDAVTFGARGSRIFGLPPGMPVTWTGLREQLHPDDRERARVAVEASLHGRSDYDVEYRVLRPDGEWRWVAARGRGLYADDGSVRGMIGVVQDVTERRLAEERLRESEQRLRATFEQAAVGIATASLQGKILELNAKFAEILGYEPGELLGCTIASLTHDEDVALTAEQMRGLLAGEADHYVIEKRFRRKDGGAAWCLTSVTLLRDASGEPRRYVGVIEDITRSKQAEAELREQTRVLEVLNRTGSKLASNLDLESLIQAVTDAATELSGAKFGAFFYNTTSQEGDAFLLYTLAGASRDAFEKFGMPRATALFAPTFRGEGILRIDDVLVDPRYGQWSPHHGMPQGHLPVRSYLAVPVVSRSGEVIGGLFFGHPDPGVFGERSERVVAGIAAQAAIAIDNARLLEATQRAAQERKELLESERAARAAAERMSDVKDEFLATLSHELRTPLSAILGWAHAMRLASASPQDLQRGIEAIERNAKVQAQLIEDLLDMSRITSGKLKLEARLVDPAGYVDAAMETLRHAAESKALTIERRLDPSGAPVAVSGDPARLQQIAWNLISNAIKFTPRGGRIQVETRRAGESFELVVADTGSGIKPEFLPHVFERFRQADATPTRRHGGLGLGLSIVKQLVELHGGTVRALSPGEGRGATFIVRLPLADAQATTASDSSVPRASAVAGSDLSGVRVLVVDDQQDARDLVARMLAEYGADVLTASDAETALRAVSEQHPDVLVSDIGMPDVDGFELLRRVRALGKEQGGRLPAIALTAFARSEDRTRALRAGFLVHVSKPVEPAELIATVASVAGRTGE